jgi:hypothetical protein
MKVRTNPDRASKVYVHIVGGASYLLFWGGSLPAIGTRKRRWKNGHWETIADSGAAMSARAVYCEGDKSFEIR